MNPGALIRIPCSPDAERHPCDTCFHRRHCLPSAGGDGKWMRNVMTGYSRVGKGGTLFHSGQAAVRVFVVHTGAFKSVVSLPDGRQRIVGFHEAGDFIGLEAFTGQWSTEAIALEASEACEIDVAALDDAASRLPALQRYVRRTIGDSLVQAQQDQFALGSMHVKERLARFLLNLSARYRARGLAYDEFTLRMTREDIGDYLGFRLETVSRVFSELQQAGLIELERRHVRIVDRAGLAALLDAGPEWAQTATTVPLLRRAAGFGSHGMRELAGHAA